MLLGAKNGSMGTDWQSGRERRGRQEVRKAAGPGAVQGPTETQRIQGGLGVELRGRHGERERKRTLQQDKDREMHTGHTEPETPRQRGSNLGTKRSIEEAPREASGMEETSAGTHSSAWHLAGTQ